LVEWWYNTNHHTTINLTPFKALYGYDPPHISMGSIPDSKVEAVDELLKERHTILVLLKEQLTKAQERMKLYADKKRHERHFLVGAWVYLKLQPYKQTSVQRRLSNKLSSNIMGHLKLLRR
jgi:hypothetical protein